MTPNCSQTAVALVMAFGLAGCGQAENKAAEKASPPAPVAEAPPAPALPAVDVQNSRQFVVGDATLETPAFARNGATTVKGAVRGDTAPVYAVPVAQGQTLTVTFAPANSNLYVNVSDAADHSGAALHRGEVDGPTATLKADRDMTFVIKPFQPRAMARRDEVGEYSLTIARD